MLQSDLFSEAQSEEQTMKPVILTATAALIALTACSPFRSGSESVVSASEVQRISSVERCRVLEVREVTIRDDEATGSGTIVGAIAGTLIGSAAGSQVGGGVGNSLATDLGGLAGVAAGSALGERVDQNRAQRQGIEYSVILGDGEELVVIQELFPSDRIAQPDSTCRVRTASNGLVTVLPGEQLPTSISAPNRTQIR